MQSLTPASLPSFLARFESFHDGLLRRIELRYLPSGEKELTVIVSAQDRTSSQGWSNVVFSVQRVSEITLREGRSSCQVLSSGMAVDWFDGQLFLAFSPWTAAPAGADDFRRSDFFVAGESCSWVVEPYGEQ